MKKAYSSDSDGKCESWGSAKRAGGAFCDDSSGTEENRSVGREEEEVREGGVPRALHLRPCMWEKFLKLQKEVEDKYNLMEGILVSQLGMGRDNVPTNIADRIVQLVSHVWIEG